MARRKKESAAEKIMRHAFENYGTPVPLTTETIKSHGRVNYAPKWLIDEYGPKQMFNEETYNALVAEAKAKGLKY